MISNITKYTAKVTFNGDVSDVEPMKGMYSNVSFRPAKIAVTYHSVGSGDWSVSAIRVWGPRVKVNGTDSKLTYCETYFHINTAPEWMRKFATSNQPAKTEL